MNTQRILASTLAALVLVPMALVGQEHEAAEQPGLFSVNLGLSVWTIVVFLGLLLVLWKFAWGPILAAVDEREKRIQGALDDAAQKHEEAQKLLAEHKEQLADARRQAQQIIQEGKDAGEQVRGDIEAKAREESQAILERARRDIERERDAALDALRRESVELALAAASKLLHEKMDDEHDRNLVTEYLDDLDEGAAGTPEAQA